MTELAFLKAFLAWENFLEETFVLYLVGRKPPGAPAPTRYAFPPSYAVASEWVVPEGRHYASWTVAADVSRRAERFFRQGRPFSTTLRANQNALDEARILRNAIAHSSASTQQKFENLVRQKLGSLPANLNVGAFLGRTVPRSSPPQSFFDFYVDRIEMCATQLVPV